MDIQSQDHKMGNVHHLEKNIWTKSIRAGCEHCALYASKLTDKVKFRTELQTNRRTDMS